MANQKINTRIVLKNDQLSAWEADSSVKLLKGEVALAQLSGDLAGYCELRVGQDAKWGQALRLRLSADQIDGLNEELGALSSKHTELTSKEDLTALTGMNAGDTAVVIETIAGEGETAKKSYTAYVYDGEMSAWKAMDGNYSADNVYFDEDITAAGNYDKVGNVGVNTTIAATGKSLSEVMQKIFTKELSSTATKPTFTFTASGNSGEIGTKYTVPAATLTMTGTGSYTYAPKNANCSVEIGKATVSCLATGYTSLTASNTAAMTKNSTVSTSAGTANAETYLSSGATYNYKAEATYTDGVMSKTNLGNDQPATQIKSAKVTMTAAATFTGRWPCYYAFTTSPKDAPTALTANNGNVTVDGVTYTRSLDDFEHEKFIATKEWYQLYYLVPTAKQSKTTWSGADTNNATLPTKASTTATVTFMDGKTAEYRVFIVNNTQPYSATTCTMKYA